MCVCTYIYIIGIEKLDAKLLQTIIYRNKKNINCT